MNKHFNIKAFPVILILLLIGPSSVIAQFTVQWLDIGTLHNYYVNSGALHDAEDGLRWPGIFQGQGHHSQKAFWIGAKNWTDPDGNQFPYYVSRIGPSDPGDAFTFPIQNAVIGRTENTVVEVDGSQTFRHLVVLDEVNPNLASDRMIHNIHNTYIGVTVDRRAHAYVNQFHDDYNIIEYQYTNTGNTDGDSDIELPNQTLNETYFFRIHRYKGNGQAAWAVNEAQAWGKFNMIDVVGDGHVEYPVSFTAQYVWVGIDPATQGDYDQFGGPITKPGCCDWVVAAGDTLGRLAGSSYVGRATIHADNSTTDPNYIRCTPETFDTCQPSTLGFMDQDEELTTPGKPWEDYYELGIRTRENPDRFSGGSTRMYPHYADRVEPDGIFWEPKNDASSGREGGYSPTTAYGPYDIGPGESIRIVVVEGVGGLSIDAQIRIGRAFILGKLGTDMIRYDANGDGRIQKGTFDFSPNPRDTDGDGMIDTFGHGLEEMTKNQWVVTSRDSMFQVFQRGINMYAASNNMTTYPIPEAPHAPTHVGVFGRPDKVDVTWVNPPGGPSRTAWQIYRSSQFVDNIYEACLDFSSRKYIDGSNPVDPADPASTNQQICGYELIETVDGNAESYADTKDLSRGVDYFYYVQAIGESQPVDPDAITGTPNGAPLRSSRYLTQTYLPVNLKRPAYGTAPDATGTVADARIVPNPVNLGADSSIRFNQEERVAFFNIPGNCTIRIYSEIGELIHTIEHTDGSGDELWNLTTSSRQLIVSGIYIAVITDEDTGDEAIQKFTVIR
ncbi:MAG: hypothetical protein OXE59_07435 [Bacteroidetes bacterium]|nr:hypothetical protein [Bacteroidota bacterium]